MGWDTKVREVDGYLNVLELNRNDSEDWVNAWNANPENRWNAENRFLFLLPQLTSFLLHLRWWRSLFYQLVTPPTEHLSNLVQRSTYCCIFFGIEPVHFPERHEKKLMHVEFDNRSCHVRQLLFFGEEGGGDNVFNALDERLLGFTG